MTSSSSKQQNARARSLIKRVIRMTDSAANDASEQLSQLADEHQKQNSALDSLAEGLKRSIGGNKNTLGDTVHEQQAQSEEFVEYIRRVDQLLTGQINTTEQVGTTLNDIATLGDAIDQLSHRSQYLSLNAMIEAARLGDDVGRGFMVIAQDMRELNQEIEETATRIGGLVETLLRVLPELRRASQHIHTETTQVSQKMDIEGSPQAPASEGALKSMQSIIQAQQKQSDQLRAKLKALQHHMRYQGRASAVLSQVAEFLDGSERSIDEAEQAAAMDLPPSSRRGSIPPGGDDDLVFF